MFSTFYHSLVRKTVASFGTLFNNIYIERTESNKTQKIKVPLSYASKERMFHRLNIGPDMKQAYSTQIVLPRMSFAITGMQYDAERKRNLIQKRYAIAADNSGSFSSGIFSLTATFFNISICLFKSICDGDGLLGNTYLISPVNCNIFLATNCDIF